MFTIAVRFDFHGTHYTYMCTDESVKIDDYVVISNKNQLSIAKVVEVHDEPQLSGPYTYTYIVQKVDFTEYNKNIAELYGSAIKRERL